MADDILTSAQNQINDAAAKAKVNSEPAVPPPAPTTVSATAPEVPTPVATPPPSPVTPVPTTPLDSVTVVVPPVGAKEAPLEPAPEPVAPTPGTPVPIPAENKVVDSLLGTPPPTPAAPAGFAASTESIATPAPVKPKKSGKGKGGLIALILFLVLSLPLGIYFVSQTTPFLQTQSRATGSCSAKAGSGASGANTCPGASKAACCLNSRVCDWSEGCATPTTPPNPTSTSAPSTPFCKCCPKDGSAGSVNTCTGANENPCILNALVCNAVYRSAADCSSFQCQTFGPTPTTPGQPTPTLMPGCAPNLSCPGVTTPPTTCTDAKGNCLECKHNTSGGPDPQWAPCGGTPNCPWTPPSGVSQCCVYGPDACTTLGDKRCIPDPFISECSVWENSCPVGHRYYWKHLEGITSCDNFPTPTVTPGPTNPPAPTPTTPPGQCIAIHVYDASGVNITEDLRAGTKTLDISDQVKLCTPIGTATKAQFRIQGITDFAPNDPAQSTSTEYCLEITIPSTLTQATGTFEANVWINGVWY